MPAREHTGRPAIAQPSNPLSRTTTFGALSINPSLTDVVFKWSHRIRAHMGPRTCKGQVSQFVTNSLFLALVEKWCRCCNGGFCPWTIFPSLQTKHSTSWFMLFFTSTKENTFLVPGSWHNGKQQSLCPWFSGAIQGAFPWILHLQNAPSLLCDHPNPVLHPFKTPLSPDY